MRSKTKKGEVSASPSFLTDLHIEKLAIGGAGIARTTDGKVVFVNDTCPGDVVTARVTIDKKAFSEADLVEIQKSGPERVPPPCPIAKDCGGCTWQHVSHKEQLRQKQLILEETLRKFLKFSHPAVSSIVPSPKTLRYRNRIQPKFKNGKLGFYKKRSHQVVPHLDCLITEEAIAQKFQEIEAELLKNSKDSGIEIYLDENEKVLWNYLEEDAEGVGFSQVNRFQNEDLKSYVLGHLKGKAFHKIYDLYAGAGNFTLPLAAELPQTPLVAVELSSKLVARGRELAGKRPIQYLQADVESFLRKTPITNEDLVILDPPRMGCTPGVMKFLGQSAPKVLVYISCHPVALARDLNLLMEESAKWKTGLRIKAIQPFEMFPQTYHMETIAVLEVDS